MSSWLPNFIRRNSSLTSMEDFSNALRDDLHQVISRPTLRKYVSGFHISGYTEDGLPDFWHLTNVTKLGPHSYAKWSDRYSNPRSDYLQRDAMKHLGWDGAVDSEPKVRTAPPQIYRNGDYKAHAVASDHIDSALMTFFQFPDFNRPRTPDEYAKYVKLKMKVVGFVYNEWAKKKIIGGPYDVYVLTGKRKQRVSQVPDP